MAFKEESPFQITKTLSAPWSAQFDLRWTGGTQPNPGEDVAFFWLGIKRFGGIVLSVEEKAIKGNFNESILSVRCAGYQNYADRTVVAKLYTLALGGVPPIIIFDLWDQHLKQFGVTIVHPQGDGSVTLPEQVYRYITITEAFNRLREAQPGWDWYIDDDKALVWTDTTPSAATAPFTLRDSDRNVDTMTVQRSNKRFRNSQWVLPAMDFSAPYSETATATAGQINFVTLYAQTEAPTITVNGLAQTVTVLGTWDGSPWYYIDGGIGVFRTPGAPALGAGDTVVISYTPPFPLGYNVRDDASIAAVGMYEAVFQAKAATTEAECLQIGQALLDLYGTAGAFPESMTFTYNSYQQPLWLTPGMILDVVRTNPTAAGFYAVEQVTSILEGLTMWRHTVKCRAGLGDVTEAQLLEMFRTPMVQKLQSAGGFSLNGGVIAYA